MEPSQQGTGVGAALLRPALARADAEGVPCYLETQNGRNVGFYGKQGFRVVSDGEEPGHGLRVWTMLRAPRLQTTLAYADVSESEKIAYFESWTLNTYCQALTAVTPSARALA